MRSIESVFRATLGTACLAACACSVRTRFEAQSAEPRSLVAVDSDTLRVSGQAFDEDLAPLVERALAIDVTTTCSTPGGSSTSTERVRATTDADGRFTVRIPRGTPKNCERALHVGLDRPIDVLRAPELEPGAVFDLPDDTASGVLNLSVVHLAPPASPKRFRHLDDDALERETRAALAGRGWHSPRRLESLLTEMMRRGGRRFEVFLTQELEDVRVDNELYLLVALRGVQGAASPLELRIADDSVLVTDFPIMPEFHAQLVNADARGESFHAANGGGYRSGRLEHWTVEVRTLDGTRIEPRAWRIGMGGGMYTQPLLEPGAKLEAAIPLSNYVIVPEAGVYEARLVHHETEPIADQTDLGNLICWTSAWTRIEIRPSSVRLTKAEDERARRAVSAIVEPGPIEIYKVTYDPAFPFTGRTTSSELVLMSLGRKSLPALFAALEDPTRTPAQHAWELAQLYNLTGIHDPLSVRGILGQARYVEGPLYDGKSGTRIVLHNGTDGPIDVARQREFARRWKSAEKGFRFEIVE